MRPFLFAVMLVLGVALPKSDEIRPGDSTVPLFFIYEALPDRPAKGSARERHFHPGQMLLTVHSLADMMLQPDKKGVRLNLNDEDTKAFAKLTRRPGYLIFLSGDSTASVTMHFTATVDDGKILFDASVEAVPMAQYLRKRFHVKSDSNDFEPAKP
ncbi:MAG TPA: hypothetical protein VGM54_11505 [Chthoniobacter sp.]|jgi:hypothetical protein